MAAQETQALTRGPGDPAAPQGRYHGQRHRGVRPRRRAGAQAQADHRRRTRPHQRAGQPPPKRWQDVEELLDAGIDVWTTLNVQHLESLADVVARITGVRVRETVPDRVLARRRRHRAGRHHAGRADPAPARGKVYLPETAKLATQNFFTPGNLTALREIALRRTAERVDDQMVDYLRQDAIEGPWATTERLLVCVGADASSDGVVRAGARLATALNAEWTAVFVERPGQEETESRARSASTTRCACAERLGADDGATLGQRSRAESSRVSRSRENITQIVVGRSRAGFFAAPARAGRLSQALVRRSRDVAVHVVTDQKRAAAGEARSQRRLRSLSLARGVGAAALSVAAAVGAGQLLDRWLHLPNLSMIFLVAVIFCAVRFGVWSAIAAAVLSFFAFDFFFVPPLYQFTISEPQEFFALLVFLVVAVITGLLAGRVREAFAGR